MAIPPYVPKRPPVTPSPELATPAPAPTPAPTPAPVNTMPQQALSGYGTAQPNGYVPAPAPVVTPTPAPAPTQVATQSPAVVSTPTTVSDQTQYVYDPVTDSMVPVRSVKPSTTSTTTSQVQVPESTVTPPPSTTQATDVRQTTGSGYVYDPYTDSMVQASTPVTVPASETTPPPPADTGAFWTSSDTSNLTYDVTGQSTSDVFGTTGATETVDTNGLIKTDPAVLDVFYTTVQDPTFNPYLAPDTLTTSNSTSNIYVIDIIDLSLIHI